MTGAWGLTVSAGPPADASQPPALREGHIGGHILPLRECNGQDNPTVRPAHGYSSVYASFCREGKEPRERCHWVCGGLRQCLLSPSLVLTRGVKPRVQMKDWTGQVFLQSASLDLTSLAAPGLSCSVRDLSVARRLSCSATCGTRVPQPGVRPTFPALQGGFLTTGSPGKPLLL